MNIFVYFTTIYSQYPQTGGEFSIDYFNNENETFRLKCC